MMKKILHIMLARKNVSTTVNGHFLIGDDDLIISEMLFMLSITHWPN